MSCLFHLSLELQYFSKIQTIDVKFAKDCSLQSLEGRIRASQFVKECRKNCNCSQFTGLIFQENYGLHHQLTRTSKRARKCQSLASCGDLRVEGEELAVGEEGGIALEQQHRVGLSAHTCN